MAHVLDTLSRHGHLGAQGELIACCWLLERGFDVFRNVAPHGPADIIATRYGRCVLIDVKMHRGKGRSIKGHQVSIGVVQMNVTRDGQCWFDEDYVRVAHGEEILKMLTCRVEDMPKRPRKKSEPGPVAVSRAFGRKF